jgi:asparagine synthase (glutamine-hydrolysing)
MCGFVGVVGEEDVDEGTLARMRQTLWRRGPDGLGARVAADGASALGFCRLAIIDLSEAGNQPLPNEDRTIWTVVNGEIYNFKELRRELVERGHTFRSGSDAEVVVHLYEELGEELVQRLRGMFALAVLDERKRTILLARDRLGIKPLYYRWDGRTLLFASELRALVEHPSVSRDIDSVALADYLTYGYVPFDRSIYRGVNKLPAAHLLECRPADRSVSVRQYWDVDFAGRILDPGEATEQFRALVGDAVRSQLVADVPVGLFLSGGLDSSTVLAFASEHSPEPVEAFSIGFDDERRTEVRYAQSVAAAFGAHHHTYTVRMADAENLLPSFCEIYDEPFFDSSGVPTFFLSAHARRSVKVALAGDGGDELFGGYGWYRQSLLADRRRERLGPLLPTASSLYAAALPAIRWAPLLARAAAWGRTYERLGEARYFRLRGFLDPWERRRALGVGVNKDLEDYDHLWLFRRFYRPEYPPLLALRYLDLKTYLVDDILTKVDRASMFNSLEVRPPLLDHHVVEFASQLHPDLLMDEATGKRVLKLAMQGMLPTEILHRGKQGFSVPLRMWLQSTMGTNLMDGVRTWHVVRDGLVDPRFVVWLIRSRSFNRWAKFWLLTVLELWYRRWIVGVGVDASAPAGLPAASPLRVGPN